MPNKKQGKTFKNSTLQKEKHKPSLLKREISALIS
jgi:hypothetical protein